MGLGSGIQDPRSGIRKNLFRIPDPGVKKAPDPGSGSATLFRGNLEINSIFLHKCLCFLSAIVANDWQTQRLLLDICYPRW
jgi:hypothetical protein